MLEDITPEAASIQLYFQMFSINLEIKSMNQQDTKMRKYPAVTCLEDTKHLQTQQLQETKSTSHDISTATECKILIALNILEIRLQFIFTARNIFSTSISCTLNNFNELSATKAEHPN